MKIIQFNHKTVANLLKKSAEEWWNDDKDAYIRFTDGSVVCIHAIKPTWQAYLSLNKRSDIEKLNGQSFSDNQCTLLSFNPDGAQQPFMSRSVSVEFDNVRYFLNDQSKTVTREYLPMVEFHYYEKGEEIGRNDS